MTVGPMVPVPDGLCVEEVEVGLGVPVPPGDVELELLEVLLDDVEGTAVFVGGTVALPPLVVPLPVAVPLPVVVSAMVGTKLEPSRTSMRPRQRFLGAMMACEG